MSLQVLSLFPLILSPFSPNNDLERRESLYNILLFVTSSLPPLFATQRPILNFTSLILLGRLDFSLYLSSLFVSLYLPFCSLITVFISQTAVHNCLSSNFQSLK